MEEVEIHDIFFSKDFISQMLLNITERTFTPAIIKNIVYSLSRLSLNQLIEGVFKEGGEGKKFHLESVCEPYKTVKWEVSKLSNIFEQIQMENLSQPQPKETSPNAETFAKACLQLQTMKDYKHPRLKIFLDEQFQLTLFEDTLEGLRGTEYDVEVQQFTNLFVQQKQLTNIGQLLKAKKDLIELTGH
mmetsp:Transcript_5539/g.5064  ORF Transcript_5539/g.5064 Transcript_5539/m.5064 type:complete len:188 (-) Transcript_5539:36-599(-)